MQNNCCHASQLRTLRSHFLKVEVTHTPFLTSVFTVKFIRNLISRMGQLTATDTYHSHCH